MECIFDSPVHSNGGCIFDASILPADTGTRQYIDPFRQYGNIAIREDEEFLLLLRAIIKVIDPWG